MSHLSVCNLHWYVSNIIAKFDTFLARIHSNYEIIDTHTITSPAQIERDLLKLLTQKPSGPTLLCYIETEMSAVEILESINIIVKSLDRLCKRLDKLIDNMIEQCQKTFPIFSDIFSLMELRSLPLEGKKSIESFVQEFQLVTYEPELDDYIKKLSCLYEMTRNLKLAQQFATG